MVMKSLRELDSVGWRFWALCIVVLYGPSFYFVWSTTYEEKRGTSIVYVFALIIAVIGASFVAAGVNTVLQKRAEKKDAAAGKESKSKGKAEQ